MHQWGNLEDTLEYYQIRDKYTVDPLQAEIIMSLKMIQKNKKETDVVKYLLEVFQNNASHFGFLFQVMEQEENVEVLEVFRKTQKKQQRPIRNRPVFI